MRASCFLIGAKCALSVAHSSACELALYMKSGVMSRRGLREVLARARRDPAAYAGEGVGEAGAVAGHVEQVRVLDGALGGHATHPRDLRLVQVVHDRHVDRVGCAADRCAPAVLRLLEGDAARVERVLLDLVDADQREQLWRELRRTTSHSRQRLFEPSARRWCLKIWLSSWHSRFEMLMRSLESAKAAAGKTFSLR